MRLNHFIAASVGSAALLALTGCGPDPVDVTHNGELEDGDGSYRDKTCDAYDIEVGANWLVEIRMTSEWDNEVFLTHGDDLVADNDDGDEGLNAHVAHTVQESGTYTVHACAFREGRGAYTLSITADGG